ncbi:GIY-YIG nuclease family protein [Streptomyces sp. NPDC127166]|uniref:GIY-YIG nuclease family protein n=1 Tax=Streptomyces sp. NPDC127166 TaxID=3345380 RepID=UPI00362524CB
MTDQHTYLIGASASRLVKIGIASDPAKRLAALQTGSPMLLSVLWSHPGDFERALHDRFAAYRRHGEWFDLSVLGDPLELVTTAVAQLRHALPERRTTQPAPASALDIRDHLATHGAGEWCSTCEMWPHKPVRRADGWCARCLVHAKDHDDSAFAFTWSRLRTELAA